MRQIFLLLSVLLIGQTNCFSQPYQSILSDSSTAWIIARNIPDAILTDSLYTTIDSSFGGHVYKSINTSSFNHGFIRQDTSSGKAWFYSNLDMTEYLIMDLSLSIGDSFLLNMGWLPDSLAIVDSVYYLNGYKHVQLDYWLQVYNQPEKLTFIEGLGSNAGILYQNDAGGSWNLVFNNYLLCSYKKDTLYYANTLFNGDCYIFVVSIEEKTKNLSWTLHPNPFDNCTNFLFDNFKNEVFVISLYDINGQLMRKIQNIRTGNLIIKREQLSSGLYFFQLSTNGQIVASGKMAIK